MLIHFLTMLIHKLVGARYSDELQKAIALCIQEGELPPGARLPSIRRLAAELGLSPGTVASAYRELAAQGLVESSQGRVSTVVDPSASEMPYNWPVPTGLVDLSGIYPNTKYIPDISRFFQKETFLSNEVKSNDLLDKLSIVGQEWFYQDGLKNFSMTAQHGTLEAIGRFLGIYTSPGKSVAMEDPGLPAITSLIKNLHLNPVPLQMDIHGVVPQSLEYALKNCKASAVIFTPRAQNPLGCAFSAERASHLRSILNKHPNVAVVENDYFSLLAGSEFFSCHTESNPWIVTRSLSKLFGSDVRLTICASDDRSYTKIRQSQLLSSGWVSNFLQSISADALKDADILEQLKVSASVYSKRRSSLMSLLTREYNLRAYGNSGLTIIIHVDDEVRAKSRMAYRGWAVQSGAQYRIQYEPFIRISVANLADSLIPKLCSDLEEAANGDGFLVGKLKRPLSHG